MMTTPHFLVCVDSDGCVFNSMEWKHRECFLPAFIQHFGLAEISARATEIWVDINLPGAEDSSWTELRTGAFPAFLNGSYKGKYQAEKNAQFQLALHWSNQHFFS